MSQEDTMQDPRIHPDALELADILTETWPALRKRARRSGLVCEGEETGGGGDGGKEEKPSAEPEGGKEEKPEPKPPWGDDKDFDPARAWKLLQDRGGDLDKIKSERDALAEKVKKHEDATKSDQEKLEERTTTAETKAKQATADAARLRVALNKGLTETQAKRLVGETEEELETDADELLASFKDDGEGGEASSRRRPQENLRPGAAPSAEPDENDPDKLAEQVSRGW